MATRALKPARQQPVRVPSSAVPASPTATVLTVALIVGALYFGRDVFIPLALAVLLSFALAPIATRLRWLGLGRVFSALIVVIVALGFVLGFAWLLTNQAITLAGDLPRYERNLREKIRILKVDSADGSGVIEQTTDFLRRVEAEIERATATGGTGGPATTSTGPSPGPATPVKPIPVEIHNPPETPLQAVGEVLGIVAAPLATIGIMLLFVIFVLLQREDLRDRFIRLFGSGDVHRTTEAMNDAGSRIGRYLLMQLCINLSFGTLIGVGLWLIGVPNPLLWGLIGAVLRFIPYVGAPIAVLFPLLLSLAVDSGWTMPIEVAGMFIVIELFCAYVLEPLLYGSSTGLSPAALVIATAFWTVLWGPVGLLLATPLTACIVVIGRYVPQLEFLEVMFGNQEVLSPSLKLYQRLLADDAREAGEVAAQYRQEHGTLRLYDELILPVLTLVEEDRQRGALDRDRQHEIAEDVIEIADEVLEAKPKAGAAPAPPIAPAEPVVLCLGARSNLDEAGAHLIANLLREAGQPAAIAATAEIVGGGLTPEQRERCRLVCVSHTGSTGLAQTRRVLRRLRAQLGPDLPVLLGLWNAAREQTEPEALAQEMGVSEVAFSLGEAARNVRERLGEPAPPVAAAAPVLTPVAVQPG